MIDLELVIEYKINKEMLTHDAGKDICVNEYCVNRLNLNGMLNSVITELKIKSHHSNLRNKLYYLILHYSNDPPLQRNS